LSVDLHIHSTASDGTVPPEKLPELAAAAGLTAIALTDHDTVKGLPSFLARQADFRQVQLIPGIELSSSNGAREMHIVGLFIDPDNAQLQEFTNSMQHERVIRAQAMQQKLHSLGYEVTDEDLIAAGAPEGIPGRPHFAEVLVSKYNFPDIKSVFERLLKRGCAGYVPRQLSSPAEVISVIKAAGGVAIWAHLFSPRRNANNFIRRTLKELKNAGLDGLEAYYSEYTPTKTQTALSMAQELNLAISGGSDFHGAIHPDIQLGTGRGNLQVPDDVLLSLERARVPKIVIMGK